MANATALPAPVLGHARLRGVIKWLAVALAVGGVVVAVVRYRSTQVATPVHYESAALDRGPIAAKVTATGTLSALVTVLVGSQVSGRIDKLYVDYASPVTKGQTIATIEPSLFRAAVAQARANHASALAAVEKARAEEVLARRSYARAQALYAQTLASRADLESAEAALGVASAQLRAADAGVAQTKAALDQAELNLRYTTIVSPIDGVVISRNVDVGQTVAAALQAPTLFTIAQDLTRMQVDTNVAEADVGKIRAGMAVTFTVDAYPQRAFKGTVRQVRDNAQTVQNVVTYDAVIDVDNAERFLKPGMTASVVFTYATRDAALRVPNGALRFKPEPATIAAMTGAPAKPNGGANGNLRTIWLLHGAKAEPATIKIGVSDGSVTEVLEGNVREGELAVIEASVGAK